MKTLLNYIGQIRFYSLVDLVLLLVVAQANLYQLIGVVLLHLGFIAYLEFKHSHKYRKKVSAWLWLVLLILGINFFHPIEVWAFLFVSFLYVKKNQKHFAVYGPFLRGLQYLLLVGGIVGYAVPLSWLAFVVIVVRNFLGDMRDITKDLKDNIRTLPIVFGLKKDFKYVHLLGVLASSLIWWATSTLSVWSLLLVLLIEISTYGLTPR